MLHLKQAAVTPRKSKQTKVVPKLPTPTYGAFGLQHEICRENNELYAQLSIEAQKRWIKEEVYRFNSLDEKKQWVEAQKHV